MSRTFLFLTLIMLLCALAPGLRAAETVHLFLSLNGVGIEGESTQKTLGRDRTIECLSYEQGVTVQVRGGMATGAAAVSPITILKRIDKSSPLLMKAVHTGQAAEGECRFYRPNPSGNGTTEHFYTVAFKKARIISVRQFVPSTIDPSSKNEPPQEEVKIVCGSITYEYIAGGITYTVGNADMRSEATTTAEDIAARPTAGTDQPSAPGKDQSLHFSLLRADDTARLAVSDTLNAECLYWRYAVMLEKTEFAAAPLLDRALSRLHAAGQRQVIAIDRVKL